MLIQSPSATLQMKEFSFNKGILPTHDIAYRERVIATESLFNVDIE